MRRHAPTIPAPTIGLALSLTAVVALSGCSTATTGDSSASSSASSAVTPSAAASSESASLPTASTSSSAVGTEEAAPAGYRYVEAPMLGLTLAIPEDMSILASGSALTTMTDEELQSEAEAEGKTLEEFHERWDNVDLVAYADDVSDGVISVELTLAPTLTELPVGDTLVTAATKSGLEDASTFEIDTLFGTGVGYQATNPADGDAASWVMSGVYMQHTDGTVFSLTLYTSDEDAMAETMPVVLDSMATVG